MRYNPPPNWPVAPGWTPEPGWTPDPSWPPAPPGWQFWVDDSAPAPAAQSYTGPQQAVPPTYGGGPQWQPPGPIPGPIGPPNNTTRNVLIAVGVGAVLIIAVVVALVVGLGGDSKPKSDEDQIRATLSSAEAAWNDSDYSAFANHVCDSSRQSSFQESKFKEQRESIGEITFSIKKIQVTGDTAKVDVDEKSTKRGDDSETLDFKKEDGDWKLC